MRISDWSSDVCSSDLHVDAFVADRGQRRRGRGLAQDRLRVEFPVTAMENAAIGGVDHHRAHFQDRVRERHHAQPERAQAEAGVEVDDMDLYLFFQPFLRSEEHTSELQSLMRISYAVFCLKKKKKP